MGFKSVSSLVSIPVLLLLSGCGGSGSSGREYIAAMAEGTYKVTSGRGYSAAEETRILAITAHLDRNAHRLVFTLADGSQRTLTFSPRTQGQWKPDCYTNNSHVLCEVADLTPGTLTLESMTFSTPLAYALCSPTRMILANSTMDNAFYLTLDKN